MRRRGRNSSMKWRGRVRMTLEVVLRSNEERRSPFVRRRNRSLSKVN